MNVLKSLTLNDKTYDSFKDRESVKSINGSKPDENGNIDIETPDLENYATKRYVDDEIDIIRHDFATLEYVDGLVGNIEALLGGI